MKKLFNIKHINILIIIKLLMIISSCSKDNQISQNGSLVQLNVKLLGVEFDGLKNIDYKSASIKEKVNIGNYSDNIQTKVIPWGNGESLTVTLIPNENKNILNKTAAVEREPLSPNIRYKLLVFKENGQYVDERNYSFTQEDSTLPLALPGGINYIFIAYSINSTTLLPEVEYSDPANKTLSTAKLSNLSVNNDLMYYKQTININSSQTNYLSIILKHKFSEITTEIDAQSTGYDITSISGYFNNHHSTADLTLENGVKIATGPKTQKNITFTNLNTSKVNGSTIKINPEDGNSNIVLQNLTIGPTSKSNISLLNNFIVLPGVKYSLKISANPTDSTFIYNGIPVVSISGKVWMRHNLGSDRTVSPDNNSSNLIFGNYYKFGTLSPVADGTTPSAAITDYSSFPVGSSTSWNSGTITNPVKSANDPCDAGFRIPTKLEFEQLLASTIVTRSGTWTSGSLNAKLIFTSKINKNAIITLPISGYRSADNGTLIGRGTETYYWTSHYYDTTPSHGRPIANFQITETQNTTEFGAASGNFGEQIRCIRE